ncbi:hypothetical protein RI138_17885 [Streptomyces sp. C11-1]|uniref:Uncharacterized protein n=1 Tax=Streptomyces durocortorensis TaxID=2811104 RepID=A0ABY9W007_9ACTN|nr:hypothetical protein [Streptomyces durocortorensis]WNF28552.1 hypothetical protein RI138_17885 [Streptomyces durocortorensis]
MARAEQQGVDHEVGGEVTRADGDADRQLRVSASADGSPAAAPATGRAP